MKLKNFVWARGFGVLLTALGFMPLAVHAVERSLVINAPQEVALGEALHVVVAATTNAGGGEHIGFFHVEYSHEKDAEWTALAYLDNIGAEHRQEFILPADRGGVLRVRVRVAFRDGLAGDVDQAGAAIRWDDGWADWQEPTARQAAIRILTPGKSG